MPAGDDVTKQRFGAFLAAVAERLAPHGFEKTGRAFRRARGSEWLFVDVERGRSSDHDHMLLRGTVGLTSDAIARFRGYRKLSRKPSGWELVVPVGDFFYRASTEPWWLIESHHDPDRCAGAGSDDIVCRGDVVHVAAHFASVVLVSPITANRGRMTSSRDHEQPRSPATSTSAITNPAAPADAA